jgi:hypothetical protein
LETKNLLFSELLRVSVFNAHASDGEARIFSASFIMRASAIKLFGYQQRDVSRNVGLIMIIT